MNSDMPTAGGPSPARSIQDFFGWIRNLGIYRPTEGRWGAGVAAGLSQRWGIDPILVRGIFVALTFAGGLGIAAYGIAWLLLPQQDGRIHLQQAIHGHFTPGFVGAALLSLALFGDPGWGGDDWFAGPPRFLALVFLIGLIWWMHRHQGSAHGFFGSAEPVPPPVAGSAPSGTAAGGVPEYGSPEYRTTGSGAPDRDPAATAGTADHTSAAPPAPPLPAWMPAQHTPDPARESRRTTRVTLGLALIAGAGAGIATQGWGSGDRPTALIAAAAALGVIAIGVLFAGLSGRRSGSLAFWGFVLTIAVLGGSAVHSAGVRSGQVNALAGDYTWRPASPVTAAQQYNLGVGQAELALTDPRILAGATAANPLRVSVRLGAGQLSVLTPSEVPVTVNVRLGAGEIVGPDGQITQADPGSQFNGNDGHSLQTSTHVGPPGAAVMIVDVRQGAGQVRLASAPRGAVTATPTTPASPTPAATPASAPSGTTIKEPSHA